MGQFSKYRGKMKDAKVGGGYTNFHFGLHKVRIENIRTMDTRDNKFLVLIKAEILETDSDKNRKGQAPEQCISMDKDTGPEQWKGFLAAAQGIDATDQEAMDEVDEDDWDSLGEDAVSKEQPYKNWIFQLEVVKRMLKGAREKLKDGDLTHEELTDAHYRPIYVWKLLEEAPVEKEIREVEKVAKKAAKK